MRRYKVTVQVITTVQTDDEGASGHYLKGYHLPSVEIDVTGPNLRKACQVAAQEVKKHLWQMTEKL